LIFIFNKVFSIKKNSSIESVIGFFFLQHINSKIKDFFLLVISTHVHQDDVFLHEQSRNITSNTLFSI
jgi:hypothetical protein